MSDRNRKSNARRKAVRKYQREHGVSYTEALRAVSDPPAPRMHQFLLLAGFEDDGKEVLLSTEGVGGPDVLWISGSTGSVKFLELFVLAAQICQMGARVVACARRPSEPEQYWTGYREQMDRFEYVDPEQLGAVVDELAAAAPAAGEDSLPAVLLIDDWAIQSGPAMIDFGRLAGLNVLVMMGMSPESFGVAQEFWKVRAATRIEVDAFPGYLGRIRRGGQFREFRRLFAPGRVGESAMLVHHLQLAADGMGVLVDEPGVVRAYRQTGVSAPVPEDFAAIEVAWPGDVVAGPQGLALGNSAAQKKVLFRDSMRITYLDTTSVDRINLPLDKGQDAD